MNKLSDFDYKLPEPLIAQTPAEPRDHSRLLVFNRGYDSIDHKHFFNLVEYLQEGDLLVLNNTKVYPARLIGQKFPSGGKVEIFLNHQIEEGVFQALGKNLKAGQKVVFTKSKLQAVILKKDQEIVEVKFNLSGEDFFAEVEKIGQVPLPPYIKRKFKINNSKFKNQDENLLDKERYQTVYAKNRGSVAAPTAGLHFTPELLAKIKNKGVKIEKVTLHVGLGTFAPIKTEDITKHQIHHEYYKVDSSVVETIIRTKKNGGRVIAVGTTTCRVLETIFSEKFKINQPKTQHLEPSTYSGWTNIYIYPGYEFKCIDGLVTNFHLPKSSLLVLISALIGREKVMELYQEAISNNYRFYSYGDAMLII